MTAGSTGCTPTLRAGPLEVSIVQSQSSGESVRGQAKTRFAFCTECGNQLGANARFCSTCGTERYAGGPSDGVDVASEDTGSDMLFLLESFCGHGYNRADPSARCHNPTGELWFDLTCIHPNPAGHTAIAEMFEAVVSE